jgi:hypothetical protein
MEAPPLTTCFEHKLAGHTLFFLPQLSASSEGHCRFLLRADLRWTSFFLAKFFSSFAAAAAAAAAALALAAMLVL